MDQYAVMGNPIQHSKSPLIHTLFAEQTQQNIQYRSILVEIDNLAFALDEFQANGGKGLNITLPFKHRAFHCVNELSERALQAATINTIRFDENGNRYGDNTDGIGLVRDLTINHQFSLADKKILILGAGGAVSGVIQALLNEYPAELVIANRTLNKALALVDAVTAEAPIIVCEIQNLTGQTFDLIINGTSASLQGEMLELPLGLVHENTLCYDMVYGKGMTPFLQWAQKQEAACRDGIGMLIEQAAESFFLWRGVRPNTKEIFARII